MKGITILDTDPSSGALSFDLRDILNLLRADAERSTWILRNVECIGDDAAEAMHQASELNQKLDGQRLLELAQRVHQVVDGEFRAHLPGEIHPWLVVRAVDSSAYDVESSREEVLASIRSHFRQVEELPSD